MIVDDMKNEFVEKQFVSHLSL